MDNLQIREMTIEDYDEIFALWQVTTKRALSDADSRENIAKYLSVTLTLWYVTHHIKKTAQDCTTHIQGKKLPDMK